MKYGYVGNKPTQADRSNSGIFSVEDVNKLITLDKWTLDLNHFDLLLDYVVTGDITNFYFDFDTTNYSVHKIITRTYPTTSTGVTYFGMRFIESGTTIATAHYDYATQLLRSSTDLKLDVTGASQVYYGASGSTLCLSEITLYGAGDSSSYTAFTWQENHKAGYVGAGVFERATVVNGINLYAYPESAATATYGVNTEFQIYGYKD